MVNFKCPLLVEIEAQVGKYNQVAKLNYFFMSNLQ